MNILMLNPVHPSVPHISAVRAWRFARELSALGHRVVLVTKPVASGKPTGTNPLDGHDWATPCVLACGNAPAVPGGTSGKGLFGKVGTAIGLLRQGGKDAQWCKEAVRISTRLPEGLAPDVVWCTFGKGEAVVAARRIAKALKRPWILDLKDSWELYVPRGLRHVMAWRLRGWTRATANAQLTADLLRKWHGADPVIVYSGVEREFYPVQSRPPADATFVVNLVGSVYSRQRLEQFLLGIRQWFDRLDATDHASFILNYFGGDVDMVRSVAGEMFPELPVRIHGYIPVEALARHCLEAAANAYVALASNAGFHHKLLELLATGKPVIAFPEETSESIALAASFGTPLRIASNSLELAVILSQIHQGDSANVGCQRPDNGRKSYSWPDQARILEQVFIEAISRKAK
ncbi:MAG: hypothetical protein QM769_04855 [Pseudoxanthomonas sp.]